MPGRIQKRYLWCTCIVLSAVIVLLLVGINAAMNSRIHTRNVQTLNVVMMYGAHPEQAKDVLSTQTAEELAETSGQTPYETLRTTNYFTAVVAADGKISLDMTGAVGLTQDDADLAQVIVERAMEQESGTTGRVGRFEFLRIPEKSRAVQYAFADVSDTVLESVQLLTISFALGSVAIACILIYAWFSVIAWLRPMEQKVDEGARLLKDAGENLEKEENLSEEASGIADGLLAASAVLSAGSARRSTISMSALLSQVCKEAQPDIDRRGGTLTADVEPDIFVRCIPGEMESMCRLLLESAARTMRQGGEVRVDLLTDGRRVGIVVQSICEPWEEGDEPDSTDIAAIRLLARSNGGSAVFAPIAPDALCTTIRLAAAQPGNRGRIQ